METVETFRQEPSEVHQKRLKQQFRTIQNEVPVMSSIENVSLGYRKKL